LRRYPCQHARCVRAPQTARTNAPPLWACRLAWSWGRKATAGEPLVEGPVCGCQLAPVVLGPPGRRAPEALERVVHAGAVRLQFLEACRPLRPRIRGACGCLARCGSAAQACLQGDELRLAPLLGAFRIDAAVGAVSIVDLEVATRFGPTLRAVSSSGTVGLAARDGDVFLFRGQL
jgi:hypothetical protein